MNNRIPFVCVCGKEGLWWIKTKNKTTKTSEYKVFAVKTAVGAKMLDFCYKCGVKVPSFEEYQEKKDE